MLDCCPDCHHPLIFRCGRHICSNPVCTTATLSADNVFQLRPRPEREPDELPPIAA